MSHLRIQSLAAAIMVAASLFSAATASARPQDVPGSGNDPKLDKCWERAWALDESGHTVWKDSFSTCMGMTKTELSLDGPSPRREGAMPAPVSAELALATVKACGTETSWAERVKGGWLAVCGDAWGNRVRVLNPKLVRCDAKAELDYQLALLVGVDEDAAYEDSYSSCVNEAP